MSCVCGTPDGVAHFCTGDPAKKGTALPLYQLSPARAALLREMLEAPE